MSSRIQEKEKRRRERLERERQEVVAHRRRRRLLIMLGGLIAVGILATITTIGLIGTSDKVSRSASNQPFDTSGPPFGTHYQGLTARRQAAGVTTMTASPTPQIHYHPHLSVWINGKKIVIPTDIGIDPNMDHAEMASLHTHDALGKIHVEGQDRATLGQFFAIWGVPLSASRLGPYRAKGPKVVQMWVNGKPSKAFGSLRLTDGQQIALSYGTPLKRPPN